MTGRCLRWWSRPAPPRPAWLFYTGTSEKLNWEKTLSVLPCSPLLPLLVCLRVTSGPSAVCEASGSSFRTYLVLSCLWAPRLKHKSLFWKSVCQSPPFRGTFLLPATPTKPLTAPMACGRHPTPTPGSGGRGAIVTATKKASFLKSL